MFKALHLVLILLAVYNAESALLKKAKSPYFSSVLNFFKLPITYRKGTLGVNILGLHASAGLFGGLLAEKTGFGGPHAEASLPFGKSAGAGLGIKKDGGNLLKFLSPRNIQGYMYNYVQSGDKKMGLAVMATNEDGKFKFKTQRIN